MIAANPESYPVLCAFAPFHEPGGSSQAAKSKPLRNHSSLRAIGHRGSRWCRHGGWQNRVRRQKTILFLGQLLKKGFSGNEWCIYFTEILARRFLLESIKARGSLRAHFRQGSVPRQDQEKCWQGSQRRVLIHPPHGQQRVFFSQNPAYRFSGLLFDLFGHGRGQLFKEPFGDGT